MTATVGVGLDIQGFSMFMTKLTEAEGYFTQSKNEALIHDSFIDTGDEDLSTTGSSKESNIHMSQSNGNNDIKLDEEENYEEVTIEEAFERCGLEVRTGYDLKTARRSMNLMLAEWANRGLNQWTIEQRTQTVTADDVDYSLGTDVIDILSAVVRRSGTDFSLSRISRDSYLSIPNKTTTGRPTQFFLDRQKQKPTKKRRSQNQSTGPAKPERKERERREKGEKGKELHWRLHLITTSKTKRSIQIVMISLKTLQ